METVVPTTADLLLMADKMRPRSQQQGIGISDLGACRRQVGYRHAGYPVTDPKGSIQAVMGSAIDDAVTRVLRDMRNRGLIPAGSVINEPVMFGGVPGHPDLFIEPVVRDTKTIGFGSQLDRFKVDGPPLRHRWQVHTYGAALRLAGHKVTTVQLDYLVRDSGDSWLFEEPFSVELVRDAFDWLREVRETELEFLSRDFAPESAVCLGCPFYEPCWGQGVPDRDPRSVLYLEDPDALAWQGQLEDARARLKLAAADEKEAKGALDALRPNNYGRGELAVSGAAKMLRWTVSTTERLDTDEVRQDYARSGATPPMRESETVKLTLVAPRKGKEDAENLRDPSPGLLSGNTCRAGREGILPHGRQLVQHQ